MLVSEPELLPHLIWTLYQVIPEIETNQPINPLTKQKQLIVVFITCFIYILYLTQAWFCVWVCTDKTGQHVFLSLCLNDCCISDFSSSPLSHGHLRGYIVKLLKVKNTGVPDERCEFGDTNETNRIINIEVTVLLPNPSKRYQKEFLFV